MNRVRTQKKIRDTSFFIKPLILMALILLSLVIFVNYIYFYPVTPPQSDENNNKFQYRLRGGDIATQLVNQGVKAPKMVLQTALFISRFKGPIKAGLYEISDNGTIYEIIYKGLVGDIVKGKITFVEGWPIWRIRQELDRNPQLTHKTSQMSLKDISELIGLDSSNPEGYFFPSTYYFEPGSDDTDVLISANRLMITNLEKVWRIRNKEIPLRSAREALILASIIEKETGYSSDRKMISAVFNNRLSKKMRLQTDPTVIYGIGEGFNGDLTLKDLKRDGPYNTYTRYGLPPTPISAPGMASLLAATQPATSKALYFVAKGDGNSYFSETLIEHNEAVNRYQKKIGK